MWFSFVKKELFTNSIRNRKYLKKKIPYIYDTYDVKLQIPIVNLIFG